MSWDRQITLKTPQEISIMQQAGRINAEALAAARAIIRPGVTTADLDAAAEEVLKKYGCYSPLQGLSRSVSLSREHQCERQPRTGARDTWQAQAQGRGYCFGGLRNRVRRLCG